MPCLQHRLQDPEIQNEIAGIVPELGLHQGTSKIYQNGLYLLCDQ